MKIKFVDEKIQTSLEETRSNLLHWVETTPEEKKQICLGIEDVTCIEEHIHVIDESLEKIKVGTFGICKWITLRLSAWITFQMRNSDSWKMSWSYHRLFSADCFQEKFHPLKE